ncbi:MAG: hypothetical protein QNJ98_16825 [Planctomycetota bacterium]|nr:hypothetical protein [Planctomycetota bacterium]
MAYITIALLLVLGFLGAVNLIAAKKPEAKALADKLAPYQGWIGAAGAAWGVFFLLRMLLSGGLGFALEFVPILTLTSLASAVLLILLGSLFGVALLRKLGGDAKADQVEARLTKLRPLQAKLGLASMGLGAWFLVQHVFRIAI